MTLAPDDPLSRALMAVDRLHIPDLDPVAQVAWQDAWDALHEVLREREAFAAVVHRGRELIDALDRYDAATEEDDMERAAELVEAAEAAFVEALNRAPLYAETEDQLSGEVAHLAALDRFADAEDGDQDDEEGVRP